MHSSSRITCRNDEEKKRSAARAVNKNIFPVFFEHIIKLSDIDVFFVSFARAGLGCCLMALLFVYLIR